MNWTALLTLLSTVVKLFTDWKNKKDRAEKQIVKLARKMDKLNEKHAKLKLEYDELEARLQQQSDQAEPPQS